MPLPKGFKHTEETKNKMRNSHLGTNNHFFGKKHSGESKRKIGVANGGKNSFWFGKKRPKETCEKMSQNMRGEKHYRWMGGLGLLHKHIRNSFNYRQWRSDVFTRDNYTCQKCNIRGGDIEAHHIDRLSNIVERNKIKDIEQAIVCEELWNINNGITFCDSCHIEYHKNQ